MTGTAINEATPVIGGFIWLSGSDQVSHHENSVATSGLFPAKAGPTKGNARSQWDRL
jgi:hypothetical protein